jgi:uncharacterized membrane protein YfcA
MGGGAVGFPVLVLLLDQPASMGRVFGLAIQSIGMVSASILILVSGKRLDWPRLRYAMMGTLCGTPLGVFWVAPYVSDLAITLVFAVIWASFGVAHLVRLRDITSLDGPSTTGYRFDRQAGFAIGVAGGLVASITGVGIDMILYAALVLLYRTDLKIAIPTSVVLMAFTSVVGILSCLVAGALGSPIHQIPGSVFHHWLAAAPVVAVGAPLGTVIVSRLRRTPTLVIVSVLCLVQFFWTLVHEKTGFIVTATCLSGVLVMNLVFCFLHKVGASRPTDAFRLQREPISVPVVPGSQPVMSVQNIA